MNETPETTTTGRDMTDSDRDFLAAIEAHERSAEQLFNQICDHIERRTGQSSLSPILRAEPMRWWSIARTNMQQGYMALARAVTEPPGRRHG